MSIPRYWTYDLSRREDGKVVVWCYMPIRYETNAWGSGADWVAIDVVDSWNKGMAVIEAKRKARAASRPRINNRKGYRND